jgi:hypothetical protein
MIMMAGAVVLRIQRGAVPTVPRMRDDPDAGRRGALSGAIGGAVVDHDDFGGPRERLEHLADAGERVVDPAGLVERRQNDRQIGRRRPGQHQTGFRRHMAGDRSGRTGADHDTGIARPRLPGGWFTLRHGFCRTADHAAPDRCKSQSHKWPEYGGFPGLPAGPSRLNRAPDEQESQPLR